MFPKAQRRGCGFKSKFSSIFEAHKIDVTKCYARLVISGDTVTKKRLHTCTNQTRVVVVKEISKTLPPNYI
ncbi:hypothetical protein HZS_1788 [Henneguya salminicola]|nr:hypothetical protein HZS_1788 [Henneguya salminicola]